MSINNENMNNEDMTIIGIAKKIANILNIKPDDLTNIIQEKLSEDELKQIIDNDDVNNLINHDSTFAEFEKNILIQETRDNFSNLKQNLGKLQTLVLINKLKKSKNCDDILNSLFSTFNNKFKNINNILLSELNQAGGNQIGGNQIGGNQIGGNTLKYYKKYIKYKIKYLQLL